MPRILLVEDDEALVGLVRDYLQRQGFEVHAVYRGDHAEAAVEELTPDLVVLDLMLPGMSGLEVCKQLTGRVPILMLTALGDEVDEIVGLEVGADDYLAKPVRPRLLLARIRSLLRRVSPPEGLHVDPVRREAHIDGVAVELSDGELDLLQVLLEHVGEVLDRDTLYGRLRGIDWDGLDRSMDLRVSRLRSRHAVLAARIKSVRGQGYTLIP